MWVNRQLLENSIGVCVVMARMQRAWICHFGVQKRRWRLCQTVGLRSCAGTSSREEPPRARAHNNRAAKPRQPSSFNWRLRVRFASRNPCYLARDMAEKRFSPLVEKANERENDRISADLTPKHTLHLAGLLRKQRTREWGKERERGLLFGSCHYVFSASVLLHEVKEQWHLAQQWCQTAWGHFGRQVGSDSLWGFWSK